MSDCISARAALDLLGASNYDMLDMRSEGEFASAAIPGFRSTPILSDGERHEVGLCYRQRGQAAAIELGYQLVGPHQRLRVADWLAGSYTTSELVLCCWRGGLRSRIAADWVEATGRSVQRVDGGYKAMRHELLQTLAQPPRLYVLAGFTGAGKTRLLDALPIREKVNLEALAVHRGSSFGKILQHQQPTQTNFENALGIGLRALQRPVLVEDESQVIGTVHLPEYFFHALTKSPVIFLDASLDLRCAHIYQEYVRDVLDFGLDPNLLQAQLIASTRKLERRLGGLLTAKITRFIEDAFASAEANAHHRWIGALLTEYYDARYRHAQLRTSRPVVFQGNYEECQQWILNQYV